MRCGSVAWLLGGAALLPVAAAAQPQATPVSLSSSAPASPVDILVRQAERWLGMERYDLAASSIERALAADPRNTQALAVAARIEAARGNRAGAAGLASRLREAGGTEEQRSVAEGALREASVDRNAIEEARRLAREGRVEEAAARYRQAFGGGTPPPAFQQEYFSVLAGTQAGGEEGRRGLARLAESPTATPRARLSFAQTQTFQPATRQEGIRRLSALANDPEVGDEARRAWRQALSWSASDPAYAPLIQAYLQRFPNDAELRQAQQAALAAAPRPDPGAAARQEGFERLEAGGATPAAWLRSAAGEGSLTLRDGVVQGFDAPAAAAALGWADPGTAPGAALESGATPIERGRVAFTLAEGRLTITEAALGAEAGLALGLSGTVDLPEDRVALRLALPVPEGAPPVALEVTGPSLNPRRAADLAPWRAWRAANPP